MTPRENDMLATLLVRLRHAPTQPTDAEAETMVRQAVTARPDLPYLLVQTVLIQDLSLKQAQDRPDDYRTDHAGDSADRIACGVIAW